MINKAIIVGNVCAVPEVRFPGAADAVANFTVATNERWKNKQGEQQEQTEFHRIVVWRKLAEICGEYLKPGSKVYIEGKIQTRSWEQDGNKRYTTEIVAKEMKMLGGKNDNGGGNTGNEPPSHVGDGDAVPF